MDQFESRIFKNAHTLQASSTEAMKCSLKDIEAVRKTWLSLANNPRFNTSTGQSSECERSPYFKDCAQDLVRKDYPEELREVHESAGAKSYLVPIDNASLEDLAPNF